MKVSELRGKTMAELSTIKNKCSRDILDARFKNTMGQLDNKSIIRKLRRDIARINTIIQEKQ
ncbi:MAG TPA: 50S ribosomal protein L29 [Deltaproteobacteria bacterium]|nr:50S ribosomal protein L29 [Deltaproteobacteria bacterium]